MSSATHTTVGPRRSGGDMDFIYFDPSVHKALPKSANARHAAVMNDNIDRLRSSLRNLLTSQKPSFPGAVVGQRRLRFGSRGEVILMMHRHRLRGDRLAVFLRIIDRRDFRDVLRHILNETTPLMSALIVIPTMLESTGDYGFILHRRPEELSCAADAPIVSSIASGRHAPRVMRRARHIYPRAGRCRRLPTSCGT